MKLLETARVFDSLQFIDFGGGFGIPYTPEQKLLPIKSIGETITKAVKKFVKEYGKQVEIRFEPGRFYVAEAGVLLARVTEIKTTPTKKFIGIDAGMNQFIRPALYSAYHANRECNESGRGERTGLSSRQYL
jgi:diaminopimelate decarboxylase